MEIRDIKGNIKFTTPIYKGSIRRVNLMQEDYILLKFSTENVVNFNIGDSIPNGFELTESFKPTLNSKTNGYDYELRFDRYYYKWKNKKFFYAPDFGGREASWSLNADISTHLGVFLRNLKALGSKYNELDFEFAVSEIVGNESKFIQYENIDLISALTRIAEEWGCEWWVTDNVINFGKCEYGTPIDFTIGENVSSMPKSGANSATPTRIYAFGSERNITPNYRPIEDSITVNGIVQKRLMLPEGVPYIDVYPNLSNEEAVEEIKIFDNVYPKRINKTSNVSREERKVKNENTEKLETQIIYGVKDDTLRFKQEYILPRQELRVTFQSGLLNGRDYGVEFKDDYFLIKEENSVPNDILYPQKGDEFVLYGYDTNFVDVQLLPEAEIELQKEAEKYVQELREDPTTYECKMMASYMFNEGNVKTFDLGDRVQLTNKALFDEPRVSRIMGYEYPLDKPYDSPIYYVGKKATYSRLNRIESKIDTLEYKEKLFSSTNVGVYIITQHDITTPTDRNVLSAKKSLNSFLRKDQTDSTDYLQKFNKGAEFGDYKNKKGAYINEEGKADFNEVQSNKATTKDLVATNTKSTNLEADVSTLKKATINDLVAQLAKIHSLTVEDTAKILKAVVGSISSDTFKSGFLGEGFRIYEAVNGDWNLEIDNVTVRKVFSVFELVIQRITHQGGMVIHSPNGAKITKVTDGGSYWKCEHDSATDFFKDDQILCQNFSGDNVKRYWRLTTSVGKGYLNLSKTDQEANSSIPQEGDEIVVLGNRTNTNRQSAIMVVAVGNNAPYTSNYSKINSYSLVGKESTRIGNLEGLVDKDFGALKGNGFFSENVYLKGVFRLTNGKTVEQELLSTNNTVEANRLQLGGEIDKAKNDAKVANDKIDGLQIKSNNMLDDSRRLSDATLWTNLRRNWDNVNEKYEGCDVWNNIGVWGGFGQKIKVKAGEPYTYSIMVRKNSNGSIPYLYLIKGSNTDDLKDADITIIKRQHSRTDFENMPTGEWFNSYITFTPKKDGVIFPRLEEGVSGEKLSASQPMLLNSSKPSDWGISKNDLLALQNEPDNIIKNGDIEIKKDNDRDIYEIGVYGCYNKLELGKKYILTIDATGFEDGDVTSTVWFTNNLGESGSSGLSREIRFYSGRNVTQWVFVAKERDVAHVDGFRFRIYNKGYGSTSETRSKNRFIIHSMKLTEGNIASDRYSSSPKDQQSELNKQITSVRTDFDVIEGQINMNVAETQRLVSVSNEQVLEATQASNKAQQNADKAKLDADLANNKALEAQINADKTKADANASSQSKLDAQAKADEAKAQADKANQEATKAKNDADKAKQAKEASEGILQSVTTKEANINVVAGEVNIKAKETTESATRAVNAEASINTKAGSIVMEASKQSAEKAIEGLDLATKNLVLLSNVEKTSNAYLIARYTLSEEWVVGESYVFTIYGATVAEKTTFGIWRDNGSQGALGSCVYNSLKNRYELIVPKMKAVASSPNEYKTLSIYAIGIYNDSRDYGATIERVKVQRGNKPTDWTPAPEDYDAKFSETNASLKVLTDQITSEVSKTNGIRTDLTQVQQSHNEFKVQVKTDVADAIDSNNEVVKASFTMNGNKIGLLGSEIDITGKVTFTALDANFQAKITRAESDAYYALDGLDELETNLGDLAYLDKIEKAKLGTTVIDGGFLNTDLLKANSIHASKLDVDSIFARRISTGNLDVTAGATIAGFEIGNGRIGAVTTPGSESFGSLSLYKDFFKIGGNYGYAMLGNDVIPASAGGAFNAVGRIVNKHPNRNGGYGFDQANYGLFIDVEGGTKNYGIKSNAALLASAFVNTSVGNMDLNGTSYDIDFSQHSIFVMYRGRNGSVQVTLPNERQVAGHFGMNTLPNGFGFVFTVVGAPSTEKITLLNIYNANHNLRNFSFSEGDSALILAHKRLGVFEYQIITHRE